MLSPLGRRALRGGAEPLFRGRPLGRPSLHRPSSAKLRRLAYNVCPLADARGSVLSASCTDRDR